MIMEHFLRKIAHTLDVNMAHSNIQKNNSLSVVEMHASEFLDSIAFHRKRCWHRPNIKLGQV